MKVLHDRLPAEVVYLLFNGNPNSFILIGRFWPFTKQCHDFFFSLGYFIVRLCPPDSLVAYVAMLQNFPCQAGTVTALISSPFFG